MQKIIICFVIFSLLLTGCNKDENSFYLESEYYGSNSFIDLNKDTLNNLIKDKKSFAIFIYQPLCFTSKDFEEVLTKYTKDNQISLYKMSFSDMKETPLAKKIKYYPSLVIYHEGKVVDYLDASSDEDIKCYKDTDEFKTWFSKYVLLKKDI